MKITDEILQKSQMRRRNNIITALRNTSYSTISRNFVQFHALHSINTWISIGCNHPASRRSSVRACHQLSNIQLKMIVTVSTVISNLQVHSGSKQWKHSAFRSL